MFKLAKIISIQYATHIYKLTYIYKYVQTAYVLWMKKSNLLVDMHVCTSIYWNLYIKVETSSKKMH